MSPSPDPIEAVSQRLDNFVADRRAEIDPLGKEARLFASAAARSLEGGKRLRARFCVSGWRAVRGASAEPDAAIIGAAAALEVFHSAALVHDDIVDNSDTRRGRASAHRALEILHDEGEWHGDARAFGTSGAILLGDLLVAWSDDLLEESLAGVEPSTAAAARTEYAGMRRDVTLGQFLDVAEESVFVAAPDHEHAERALRVAEYKSARYSILQPLLLGAALGGADPAQHAALAAFGLPIGMAFQLRDDVLGVFGDAMVTGKPVGDDLREGKRTVLIAYAREGLTPGARREFDAMLGDPYLRGTQITVMQQAIESTGALARVEARISDYAREADAALSGARFDGAALDELRALARAATTRTA